MDNKEILTKLRELENLLSENKRLEAYMTDGCALEAIDQIESLKESLGSLPGVPSVVNAMPIFPPDGEEYKKAKKEAAQSSKLLITALAITAAMFVIYLLSKSIFFVLLAIGGGVASFVINKTHKLNKAGLRKKEKVYNEATEEARQSLEKFHTALACYEQEAEAGVSAAKQYGQRYREKYGEFNDILDSFEKNKNDALIKYSINQVEIESHDYISEEYYHHVSKLIAMLQSGRADNYKEALNMAIEEERQEAIELARQEEEARRLAAMERQAEEERRHNMMMERQQAAHDRAMARAAQEQADAQRRAAIQADKDRLRAEREAFHQKTVADSEARKQAAATKSAGIAKCASCANNRSCPSHIKNSGAGLTCGGYRPYGR